MLFGFYNRWWRYVSTRDMWGAARGVTVASALTYLVLYAFPPENTSRLPRGVAALDFLLLLAFVAGTRLLARTLIERPQSGALVAHGKEVLIVGAGDAGQLMVREMQRNRQLHYTPIGFVDDDPRKRGDRIHGVRILGTTDDIAHVLRDNKPDEVLIAIPSAPGAVRRQIVEACRAQNVPVKTLPGLHELIAGDLNLGRQIRPVQVEDVLGRQQVEVDLNAVATYVKGKTVLVTGAGGSIGSELCRQLARLGVARLVLVDKGESPLFEIERELVDEREFPAAIPVLADTGDRPKMRQVFERYQPKVVFHAAAYKHVGMLEANPLQAVSNNVLATRSLAEVAVEFGVERFVLISTDKAANPKNVMGQSKAICEWIVESFALHPESRDAVRRGALRQRARLIGLGDPDLPPSDRARRPRDRHEPRHDALLHDDPGGVVARRAGGGDGRARPGLRARHGRAGAHPRSREADDPPLRPEGGGRGDRLHGLARRREGARGALERGRGGRRRPRTRRSCAPRARRSTPAGSRTSWRSWSGWSRRATRSASSASSARWSSNRSARAAKRCSKTRCTNSKRRLTSGRVPGSDPEPRSKRRVLCIVCVPFSAGASWWRTTVAQCRAPTASRRPRSSTTSVRAQSITGQIFCGTVPHDTERFIGLLASVVEIGLAGGCTRTA